MDIPCGLIIHGIINIPKEEKYIQEHKKNIRYTQGAQYHESPWLWQEAINRTDMDWSQTSSWWTACSLNKDK